MAIEENIISKLLKVLPAVKDFHSPGNQVYDLLDSVSKSSISNMFSENSPQKGILGSFGEIDFPYFSMGAIDSTKLFGLDELIIFSFYWKNKDNYKRVADMGANIGLHSIMMSKAGFEVSSYEPDPVHFDLLKSNIDRNIKSGKPKLINKAISVTEGVLEFTRVLGNTTGSHLSGAKKDPYGKLEKFDVQVEAFVPILRNSDLLKIDIEGHESTILLETNRNDWLGADAIIEISSQDSAQNIFEHFQRNMIGMFAQKIGWKKVSSLEDMPTSYKEGSLFISCKDYMPW